MTSIQILLEDYEILKMAFAEINQNNNVPTTMFLEQYRCEGHSDSRVEIREGLLVPRQIEFARILRNLKQRFSPTDDHRDLIGRIRCEIIQRERPDRNTRPEDVPEVLRAVAEIGRRLDIPDFKYSEFQWRGWQIVLNALSQAQHGNPAGVVATAPTGSGKTETFMLPIIKETVQSTLSGSGHHFVFIYPRTALAQDQLSRILRYTSKACKYYGLPDHRVIVGLQFTGISSKREKTLSNRDIFINRSRFRLLDTCPWCGNEDHLVFQAQGTYSYLRCPACETRVAVSLSKDDHSQQNPNLMVTTAESLDNMYLDWDFRNYLPLLDGIIFDEAHLFNQVYGAHIHHLIQRIRNIVVNSSQRDLLLVASSATIADPTDFANRLFYGGEYSANEIYSIDANEYQLKPSGLETFVFLQTDNSRQTMSSMIQTIMATMHGAIDNNRRAIIFAGSLDTVGRLKVQFDDAEITNQLWRMRIDNDNPDIFQFETLSCPHTTPYVCSIYDRGECWRGILGGYRCHHDHVPGLNINALETQAITGNTQGSRSLDKPVIIGTSALEVGIDDPTVQTTLHYRPPRTVFDFIQRRGRAGRDENDVAYTVVVLGQDSSDHFYLVRRHRLIEGSYSLPLNPDNPVVTRIHDLLAQSRDEGFALVDQGRGELDGTWLWLINSLRKSPILSNTHQGFLDELSRTSDYEARKEKLRKWIDKNLKELEAQLADRGMFRTAQHPTFPILVTIFEDMVAAYDSWVEEEASTQDTEIVLSSLQQRLGAVYAAFQGNSLDRNRFTNEFNIVSQALQRMLGNIQEEQREARERFRETRAWHDFFFHLRKIYDQPWNIYIFANVVKYVYQALFFLNRGFDKQLQDEIDVYVPDNFFGNITPMRVHIGDQNRRTTEPVTYLESLFYPYRISYRYGNNNSSGQATPMYMLDSRSREVTGNNQVRIRPAAYGLSITDPENSDYTVRKVREIRVMEVQADERQNIRMCQTCFRIFDVNFDQSQCECGGNIEQGSIFVDRTYTRHGIYELRHRITIGRTFSLVPALDTWTKVNGSQVSFTPRHGGRRQRFNAWMNPSLYFAIPTKGITWRLPAIEDHIEDNLHAASHIMIKAMASIVGVREDQLAYSWNTEDQEVVIWEQYEGGAGLSEIFADTLQRNPLAVYQEMVSVVACPIYLSEQKGRIWDTPEQLHRYLSSEFGLPPDTELFNEIVQSAVAETNTHDQDLVCTDNDGCPVCLASIVNTQEDQPRRSIAWQIVKGLVKRYTETDRDNILSDDLFPVIWLDANSGQRYVLVF